MKKPKRGIIILLVVVPIALAVLSLFIGKYHASPGDIIGMLIAKIVPSFPHNSSPVLQTAILQVRLPRILLALLVGMSLWLSPGLPTRDSFAIPLSPLIFWG
jgi:iron complex transport system permease protein